MKYFFVLMFVVIASTVSAQGVYRYKDPVTGATVVTDQPPPKTVQGVEKEFSATPGSSQDVPYETARAMEKYPVVVYTTLECGDPCTQARDLLNKRGVPFTEKIVATTEQIEELKKLVGSRNVPSISVGSQAFEGFSADSWNKLLDLAGYPKTAPYGSKPSGAFKE